MPIYIKEYDAAKSTYQMVSLALMWLGIAVPMMYSMIWWFAIQKIIS